MENIDTRPVEEEVFIDEEDSFDDGFANAASPSIDPSVTPMAGGAGKRSFTVVAANHGKNGGRYMSATPMAAAKKAGRQLFNEAKKTIRTIHFVVRETTRGSAKKEFKYVITKHKLAKAKTIERGGVKVHVHHEYAIVADK
jgi:hypothetical protein